MDRQRPPSCRRGRHLGHRAPSPAEPGAADARGDGRWHRGRSTGLGGRRGALAEARVSARAEAWATAVRERGHGFRGHLPRRRVVRNRRHRARAGRSGVGVGAADGTGRSVLGACRLFGAGIRVPGRERLVPVEQAAGRARLWLVQRMGRPVRVYSGRHHDRLPRRTLGTGTAGHRYLASCPGCCSGPAASWMRCGQPDRARRSQARHQGWASQPRPSRRSASGSSCYSVIVSTTAPSSTRPSAQSRPPAAPPPPRSSLLLRWAVGCSSGSTPAG